MISKIIRTRLFPDPALGTATFKERDSRSTRRREGTFKVLKAILLLTCLNVTMGARKRPKPFDDERAKKQCTGWSWPVTYSNLVPPLAEADKCHDGHDDKQIRTLKREKIHELFKDAILEMSTNPELSPENKLISMHNFKLEVLDRLKEEYVEYCKQIASGQSPELDELPSLPAETTNTWPITYKNLIEPQESTQDTENYIDDKHDKMMELFQSSIYEILVQEEVDQHHAKKLAEILKHLEGMIENERERIGKEKTNIFPEALRKGEILSRILSKLSRWQTDELHVAQPGLEKNSLYPTDPEYVQIDPTLKMDWNQRQEWGKIAVARWVSEHLTEDEEPKNQLAALKKQDYEKCMIEYGLTGEILLNAGTRKIVCGGVDDPDVFDLGHERGTGHNGEPVYINIAEEILSMNGQYLEDDDRRPIAKSVRDHGYLFEAMRKFQGHACDCCDNGGKCRFGEDVASLPSESRESSSEYSSSRSDSD